MEKDKLIPLLKELTVYIAIILISIFVIPEYVACRVQVDGISMENTLLDNDQLFGEKISRYSKDGLKRYDIIFFMPQGDESVDPYIKRIIGLPGETVQIKDSVIYINGAPIGDGYSAEPSFKAGNAKNEITLGEDEYFVLGDNRNHSIDSRSERVGVVRREYILGRVLFRMWPFARFGKL